MAGGMSSGATNFGIEPEATAGAASFLTMRRLPLLAPAITPQGAAAEGQESGKRLGAAS